MQLAMFDRPSTAGETGDPLERFYTPLSLAVACVERIAPRLARMAALARRRGHVLEVLEPSVGDAAFVLAVRAWAAATNTPIVVRGVDVDPAAAGLELVDHAHVRDFATVLPTDWGRPTRVVLGNPPFSVAAEHLSAARELAELVAFILPLSTEEGCRDWAGIVDVWPWSERWAIRGRPWTQQVRGCGWFVSDAWSPTHPSDLDRIPPHERDAAIAAGGLELQAGTVVRHPRIDWRRS